MTPAVLVVMGVSGSGKTTLGTRLASRLVWAFKEGDELHPPGNLAKMRLGEPLSDVDRAPWLAAVAAWIDVWLNEDVCGVITCSALKRNYRRYLADGRPAIAFVFLDAKRPVLAKRLAKRRDHFMPASMLESQLATLETPTPDEPVIWIETDEPVAAQIDTVVEAMATYGRRSTSLEPF